MVFHKMYLLLKQGRDYSHSSVRTNGLTETEHMLCTYVLAQPNCTQDEAAAALYMDKTTVAKALLTLEKKQYLQRCPDEHDHRRNLLSLTEEGRRSTLRILSVMERWQNQMLSALTAEEKQSLEALCGKLLVAAEKIKENQK